jgi:hypothetical protein
MAVYAFVWTEVKAGRPFPTTAEITRHMGWNHTNSAKECLEAMAKTDRVLTTLTDARGRRSYALKKI